MQGIDLVPFMPTIRLDETWKKIAWNIRPLTREAQLNQLAYYKDDPETLAKSICWWMKHFYGRDLDPVTYPEYEEEIPSAGPAINR